MTTNIHELDETTDPPEASGVLLVLGIVLMLGLVVGVVLT
jgi:hypothetical protein